MSHHCLRKKQGEGNSMYVAPTVCQGPCRGLHLDAFPNSLAACSNIQQISAEHPYTLRNTQPHQPGAQRVSTDLACVSGSLGWLPWRTLLTSPGWGCGATGGVGGGLSASRLCHPPSGTSCSSAGAPRGLGGGAKERVLSLSVSPSLSQDLWGPRETWHVAKAKVKGPGEQAPPPEWEEL